MKSIELGTFALVVLFIGGMTIKHNDQIREDQQAAETLEQVRMKQERDNEANSMATKAIIRHDGKSKTNTVFVSLDASSSFDGGNAADQVYFTRTVPDKSKPICAEYEENCTPSMGRGCECVEIQLDACGDEMYEPLCAEYADDCDSNRGYTNIYKGNGGYTEGSDDCRCIEYLEVEVEYLDDCQYQAVDHAKRQSYLKRLMSGVVPDLNQRKQYEPDNLKYRWEQTSGPKPKSDVQKYATQSSMVLELGEGVYTFKCTVSDSYDKPMTDVATHRVIVTAEPNNPPEAYIKGVVHSGNPNKK